MVRLRELAEQAEQPASNGVATDLEVGAAGWRCSGAESEAADRAAVEAAGRAPSARRRSGSRRRAPRGGAGAGGRRRDPRRG